MTPVAGQRLQSEMDAECLFKFSHDLRRKRPDLPAYALNRYRPDLLGLRLRVLPEPGLIGPQKNLKRVDARHVRGDRDYRYHATRKADRGRVGGIVANNNGRAGLAGFGPARRIQADSHNVAAAHLLLQAVGGHGVPGGGLCFIVPGREGLLVCFAEFAYA
jgi:hypothetical protein